MVRGQQECIFGIIIVIILLSVNLVGGTLNPPAGRRAGANNSSGTLSRKRRYVAFPEGSSVTASMCMTCGVIGNPNDDWLSWAVNWGIAYDVPNYTWAVLHWQGFKNNTKSEEAIKRRSRRDLYEKIELAIDHMGFNGHACIARALCESSKYLRQRRGNMVEALIKTIFSLPAEPVRHDEPPAIHTYDRIYRRSRRGIADCALEYRDCHFSLLELALGKYSVPPTKHGPKTRLPSRGFM